ncbi:protein kinase domain protein [Ichthyophthirius multifiliis]|uniref:Cyclin-dependent kinase 2 homolog n=1 Tax=Ichthyophthirius multifiliis TaxID=5932 RepID=G0QX28_ICHMU|nr:protein kinase domain protein [Ichthyophthirius multifiliis]EGR30225.1 protein kinase domain protein [Ichthyophthirius multifiliis]|eukprot:XP_004031821.1 protein kinase domain protein [Ichthyophthirius multifiliis]
MRNMQKYVHQDKEHMQKFMHDIKWENLLIDKDGNIVITDFGLSREFGSPERALTANTYTVNYRPPEIILGSTQYGPKSDMWALGVVFIEILMKLQYLFFSINGNSTEVLQKIYALRGTPSPDIWEGYDKLPWKIEFTECNAKNLSKLSILQGYSQDLIDVLDALLQLDPNKRPNASELLDWKYFKECPNESIQLNNFAKQYYQEEMLKYRLQ